MTQRIGDMPVGTYVHYGYDKRVVRIVEQHPEPLNDKKGRVLFANGATRIAYEYPDVFTKTSGHYVARDGRYRRVSAAIIAKKHTPPAPDQINVTTVAVMYNSLVSKAEVLPNMSSVEYAPDLVDELYIGKGMVTAVLHNGRLWYIELKGQKLLVSTLCHVERRY